MLTKLTITRGFIDTRKGIEEARPSPSFDYDSEMAASVDPAPLTKKIGQPPPPTPDQEAETRKKYEHFRNNALMASHQAHTLSATASTPDEHYEAAHAHDIASEHHDKARNWGRDNEDHPHLDMAIDHDYWGMAHDWAAHHPEDVEADGGKVHIDNYLKLSGWWQDEANHQRWKEKRDWGDQEEDRPGELIGKGRSQREVSPERRRMQKAAASRFLRRNNLRASREIMNDPDSAKDPGFDPDLPSRRTKGWAD